MKLLTKQERVINQKRREARTKAYNKQLQKEGLTNIGIYQTIDEETDKIIARKQFKQEINRMSKTATRKPKAFPKRCDAYTAWVITFGHRWITIAEVEQWGMWVEGSKLVKYIDCKMRDGKAHARLKTPEEIEIYDKEIKNS